MLKDELKKRPKLDVKTKKILSSENTLLLKAQIEKLEGKKRVSWTNKDIVRALSMRSFSLKAYETARKKLGLPLPCSRTLRVYAKNFTCAPGISKKILQILGERYTDSFSKICRISFDEMSIDSR